MSLEHINLSKNKLVGTIPKVFGHLENLTELYLFGNKFSQALPPELGKHSLGLIYVQVDDNELTGVIPEGLCDGGHLYCFKASRNQLSGSIPTGLANCASLQQLKLDSNQLSGGIP
jgi:kinase